jgi:hypothetical protein
MVLVFSLGILASPIFGQQINISSGAYFNNSGSTYIVVNNGNFVNNGTFNKDTETVIFSGNTARTISGNSNTDMYNLSVTNTGGITTELNQLTVSDLTIASSCKFTIASAKSVEVSGTLTNNASTGGLFLKSDATGTASLIHNTNSVPATVERYISGSAEDWHFLSSPISNQSISGTWLPTGTYGNLTGYDLYLWNEPNNCWIYLLDVTSAINWGTVHPGSDFETGRGYLYSVQATNPTNEFVGNLNNGTLDYSVAFSGAEVSLKGFNLVGNPYPSSIDWEATTGWDRYNLISSGGGYDMWIWNPAANNYGVCNSFTGIVTNGVTRYIAPMQGFFVRAASSGNITFDNNARVQNGASAWMKGKVQEENSLSLSVSSKAGFGSDEILLRFGYLSNESGSMKLFSRELSAPSLFMSYKSDFLSVRYLTNTNENTMVPLMFTPGVRGDFSITCNFELNNFEIVRLEDRKTHIIHDMKVKNTYSFHSTTSDSPNRFVLYFGPIDSNFYNEFPARIYTDGFQLVVDLTLVGKETDIVVYDLMGRLLLHQKLQGESQHKLNLNADTQIIVVSLRNPDGSLNQKVFWLRK